MTRDGGEAASALADAALRSLVGQRVPGGCDRCDGSESVHVRDGLYLIQMHHAPGCPVAAPEPETAPMVVLQDRLVAVVLRALKLRMVPMDRAALLAFEVEEEMGNG